MNVRFWNPARQFEYLETELVAEMLTALRAGDLVMRAQMYSFEQDFAALIGRTHCVGVSNCTDGLRLILGALGIGRGDEVITVAHTFVATVASIHHVGATPILIDVASDHEMDVDLLGKAITPRTRAVIPVHLNGRTCDMPRLMELADAHRLMVVEDAAQAITAKVDGRVAGSFGVAAAYSFYPAKLLGAFGDAGAVVTDDDSLARRLRLLRDHGRATKTELDGWGWNCRLDNLQASVLNAKLPHVPAWIERRREIASMYQAGLADVRWLTTPPPPESSPAGRGRYDVFQNYVIEATDRDRLVTHLANNGVETLISWPIPTHHQPGLGLAHFQLPVTESLSRRVLSLPLYPELKDEEVGAVVDAVRSFGPMCE